MVSSKTKLVSDKIDLFSDKYDELQKHHVRLFSADGTSAYTS